MNPTYPLTPLVLHGISIKYYCEHSISVLFCLCPEDAEGRIFDDPVKYGASMIICLMICFGRAILLTLRSTFTTLDAIA